MSNLNPTGRDIRPKSPSTRSRGPNEWSPGLGSIPDDSAYSNDFAPPPSFGSIMQHSNRSVPSLPSEQQPMYSQDTNNAYPPPSQPYDPTASLNNFNALHISDPVTRVPSAMSANRDPIPRATSSASYASNRLPRHANTLPSQYSQSDGSSYATAGDAVSSYSRHSDYDGYDADSIQSPYSQESGSFAGQYSHPQQWGQPPSNHNQYYSAASSAIGVAPTPQPLPSDPYSGQYQASQSSLGSSHSAPYGAASGYSDYGHGYNSYGGQHSYENADFEGRPSAQRMGTSSSMAPSSQKSKAVDLSAPPYTKEYIDQYRQRIKADPDPEAHFLYAKYLVDAARKLRSSNHDQRAAKKYSEVLIGEALKVVRRLATQGQAYDEAQFFLANCFGTGALGLQVDHERAYHLYLQAAKQNHAASSYRVAVCNEIGAGTRKDPARAAAFYRKAASLGDTAAMYKLGMILLNGHLGEAPNPREAINWLKRAAEQADQDNPHALYELALLHQQPQGTLVPYDANYAKHLFTQAAQLGYIPAQFRLGQCYEFGALGCPVDPKRSIAWYTKAAEKGDPEAELALSGWYLTGSEGVLKQSDSEAYLWARRAANKGLSKAEYAVGYYAEVGIGVKQDIEFAKRWYMRAAAQGNKRAMNRLTEMKRQGNKRMNAARPTRQQAKDECVIF